MSKYIEEHAHLYVEFVCKKRCEYWSPKSKQWRELYPGDSVCMNAGATLHIRDYKDRRWPRTRNGEAVYIDV